MSETRQCMNFDMRNKQCIHVTAHSGEHEFQHANEDRSEDIRLRFARDVRDREIDSLTSLLATADARVVEQGKRVAELEACLEIAMSMWVAESGNRTWGATERERRDRCAKALGRDAMQRITTGFQHAGPTRKA